MEKVKRFLRKFRPYWIQIRIFLVAFLAYLLQMTVMPYIKIGNVTPSLLFATVSIITICYGRLRGIWIGALYGLLLETMLPTRTLFNLLLYPVAATLGAFMFSDKTDRTLEYERSIGKAGRNRTPFLRTPMCAMVNTIVYEIVNVAYIFLREGSESITSVTIFRAFLNVFLTTLLTVILMVPVRHLFGYYRTPKIVDEPKIYM